MSFPVWRELKHSRPIAVRTSPTSSCNVLSRLKGIETQYHTIFHVVNVGLAMSFPVWRELKLNLFTLLISFTNGLQCPFPFEGNWNTSTSTTNSNIFSCNVLSRLKGIETLMVRIRCNKTTQLAMSFPVWRELKLTSDAPLGFRMKSCNVLSRLKGIETFLEGINTTKEELAMSFPVWRELKPSTLKPRGGLSRVLAMSFPVWRELKHYMHSKVSSVFHFLLAMSFPVWRELKLVSCK